MNEINKLLIIAAEPSGDQLAAEFIEEVRKLNSKIEIRGIGGKAMADVGVKSEISIDGLAILGLAEALNVWQKARGKAAEVGKLAADFKPDAAVMIDSWGFTLRAAKEIKKNSPNTKLIKMIGPQVWATRAGRAITLANVYDEIWCIHEFELPFYQNLNIKAQVIGNPALGREQLGDAARFIELHDLEGKRIIGVLPGSRKREIENISKDFVEACKILRQEFTNLEFVVVAAETVAELIKDKFASYGFEGVIVDESEKADAFASFYASIACSGTVTTELALNGVPFVVGYRLDWPTYFVAKNFLLKSPYVCLINVAAGEEVSKELLQDDLSGETLAIYIRPILRNQVLRTRQIRMQNDALKKMGLGGEKAALKAAKFLLDK